MYRYLVDNLELDKNYAYTDNTTGSTWAADKDANSASRNAKLKDLHDKMAFDQCQPPFVRSAKSMAFGGASMQFPSHTKESYLAAVRMGAGLLSVCTCNDA